MPHEMVTVQVGQCGNQIASKFWDLAYGEATVNRTTNSDSLSTFFDTLPDGSLKARSVLVDMEESVVADATSRGGTRYSFRDSQVVTDVSGSGNNWARGFCHYGDLHSRSILRSLRTEVERCDSLQCFSFVMSSGGGTGSGLGSRILRDVEDAYPGVLRFATAVLPSEADDVITSPYNSMFCTSKLAEHADCVMPLSNDALGDVCLRIEAAREKIGIPGPRKKPSQRSKKSAFDQMNLLAARMLLDLTSCTRFAGPLDMDLGEVVTNLVPFPKMQFLVSSLAPFPTLPDDRAPRQLDYIVRDAFASDHQLLRADPRTSLYLACALVMRGDVSGSEIRGGLEKLKSQLEFPWWAGKDGGWKVGQCAVPPPGQSRSLLCLANNVCVAGTLETLRARFSRLYAHKAHLHHYLEFMEEADVTHCVSQVDEVIANYAAMTNSRPPPEGIERQVPVV